MSPLWLVRMARWVRNPPGPRKVTLVLAVVAICLLIYAVERWIGWPEALTGDRLRAPLRLSH